MRHEILSLNFRRRRKFRQHSRFKLPNNWLPLNEAKTYTAYYTIGIPVCVLPRNTNDAIRADEIGIYLVSRIRTIHRTYDVRIIILYRDTSYEAMYVHMYNYNIISSLVRRTTFTAQFSLIFDVNFHP